MKGSGEKTMNMLDDLGCDVRGRAILAMHEQGLMLNRKISCASCELLDLFTFGETPEGFDFWHRLGRKDG